MDTNFPAAALALLLSATTAGPGSACPKRLGEHPAVIVKRLESRAGYDYASKFYPHPAWLYLLPAPPADTTARGSGGPDEQERSSGAKMAPVSPAGWLG